MVMGTQKGFGDQRFVKPAMVSPAGALNQRNTNIKLAQRFDKRFAGVGVFTYRLRR